MRALVVRWLIIVVAVFLIVWGLPQTGLNIPPLIQNNDLGTLALFAAVLAVLNTFVRPILKFLSIPITCMTAGLFGIVINAVMFLLAAFITNSVGGGNFQVNGFLAAVIGAIAISVVSVVANIVVGVS